VVDFEGRRSRMFQAHGSIFHRLPFLVRDPRAVDAIACGAARLRLMVWADAEAAEGLETLVSSPDGRASYAGVFVGDSNGAGWRELEAALTPGAAAGAGGAPGIVRYGSRAFTILDVRFYGDGDRETLQFAVGSRLKVDLDYRINDAAFDQRPTFVVAFQKDGVTRSHRFWTDAIAFGPS